MSDVLKLQLYVISNLLKFISNFFKYYKRYYGFFKYHKIYYGFFKYQR